MRTTLLAALALLALATTACFRESDENTNEGVDTSPGELAVEVRLTDDGIEMPDETSAGAIAFEITNSGTTPHGFAIEGVDAQLDDLRADQRDTLRIDLEPGTYTVYSPVEGDRDAGLELELTVNEDGGDGGAPLNEGGIEASEEQEPIDE